MDAIEEIFKKNKVKPTAMRMLVLRYLVNNKSAVSLANMEEHFENSDRTTLYRTLKTFVKRGVAHQIDDGTGIAKYALCEEHCNCEVGTDLHLHFHCTNCNETVCLTEHKIPHINLPESFITENVNLVVKGTCDKCNV